MVKQYVNLPYDADKNFGNRVAVEVEASSLGEEDVALVEWWVEPGGDNQDEKYLSRRSRARPRKKVTKNKKDKFKNKILLPHIGGDKYTVKCSKRGDRSSPVELEEFEIWRKLFYTVHYMNADCKTFFDELKGDFEKAFGVDKGFIELENKAMTKTLVDEKNTKSSNALTHLYKKKPKLSDRPFHLRLVVLNDIYEPKNAKYKGDSTAAEYEQATDRPLAEKKAIRSVKARINGRGSWYNVKKHATLDGEKKIKVKLDEHDRIKKALDDGKKINVKIRTRERSHYLGHSIGNFCCVRINEPGSRDKQKMTVLQTLTHEVGHGVQQVVKRERLYNAKGSAKGWEKNDKWHTNKHGGQGPHCSTNAKLVSSRHPKTRKKRTSSGKWYVHDSGTLCTMFFRSDDQVDAKGEFCDSCEPRLKRVNIGSRQMKRQGWNRY